jgi:hypothetical protein
MYIVINRQSIETPNPPPVELLVPIRRKHIFSHKTKRSHIGIIRTENELAVPTTKIISPTRFGLQRSNTMELFPSTRVPLLQPTTRTEEELMQSRMAEHKPARMPSTAATENLQHSAESRNSGASQERSDRIAPRDSYSSSEAQLEINYQEVSIANIFRGFLGNLPSLDVPRERMRSIERSLSQKSLGECSEETGRSRARSIERSLSHKSPRDHSTGTGHFRSGDQSVADYSKSSDPFRARKPDQYESRCEPSQPRIPQARPEQYQSREYAPPQQGNMEALYLGQQNALGSTPISLSPLSWRLDPRESLSDWQIKVVRTDSCRSKAK